ncbi:MAG: hypothetical protein PHU42_01550 [Patescibacteria group bacterium]|nr:hypothetical protein [Patescibacteria group bacterium]
MIYSFILGKNTALSVAEIFSVLKRGLFVFVVLSISPKALIIKLDKRIEKAQDFLDKLGGTIKIAEVFTQSTEQDTIGPILGYIESRVQDSKFVFGVSLYGLKNNNFGFDIKKELKKVGINSRFVRGKEDSLSAPEIKNNKILEKGADFVLIRNENEILIGKTVAIQDYESYSYRDYGRPRRNAKSGMLPPKVAQIMLNLIPLKANEAKSHKLIYDPFCGNGTILQEVLLMGHKVIGSDISEGRVYDTRKNLKWLKNKYNLDIEPEKMVFQADALNLTKKDLTIEPDAIVSEVYLGPPLTERATEKEILNIITELEGEYKQFLQNTYNLLPTTYYMVLALPFYNLKSKAHRLNIFDDIQKIGYNVIDPFDSSKVDLSLLPEFDAKRKTILYSRPDQIVGREIVILARN